MPQVITYSWKNISLCFFDEAAKGIDQSCDARVESIDAFIGLLKITVNTLRDS